MDNHGFPQNKYNLYAWILGEPNIGDGVWIGAFTLIDALYAPLTIGKGCNISSGAQIVTHDTSRRCVTERKYNKIDFAPVELEDYVYVGTNATILMGSKIGHHSIIAAGTVIKQYTEIPPYSLVAGVPGVIKKSIEFMVKEALGLESF